MEMTIVINFNELAFHGNGGGGDGGSGCGHFSVNVK